MSNHGGPSRPIQTPPGRPQRSPSTSMSQRRISVSSVSSRRSSHMHEIQPPRRLSAHQVLLLTPFGTVPTEPPAMGRENSSLGTSLPRISMVREPSSSPRSHIGPRTRHSLAASVPTPSPLSQPLTTIPSSDTVSSAAPSREVSDEGAVGTVDMTRSNSLPVLTLRELEAMKEKDTELGIARGGDWAWVGRDDEDDMETPGLSDASTLSTTPPSFPFDDPFAPQQGTYRRTEETAQFGSYRPVATAEGYHYSPQRDRRVSDIPSTPTQSTPRPSGLESPRGTRMSTPQRPKITRYKTSPALSQGLGLTVVVRPDQVGVQVDADAGGSLGRKGRRINLSTVERREQRHAQMRDDREFGERRGSWTPVDVVDSLARSSISSSSSRGGFAFPRSSISSSSSRHIVLVDRAMSIGSDFARVRVDSLDSSLVPRRGSLGLGGWRKPEERRTSDAPSWHERRGSWAEGWKKDT